MNTKNSRTFMETCTQKGYKTRRLGDALGVSYNQAKNIIHFQDWELVGKHKEAIKGLLELDEEQYQSMMHATQAEDKRRWEIKHPPMTEEQKAAYEQRLSEYCTRVWNGMSDEAKRQVHADYVKLGFAKQDVRSGLDRLIDKACGVEE